MYSHSNEDIIQTHVPRIRHFLFPYFIGHSLLFREYAEVRTRFCLQPLEVIDLVPLVCRL
jgi:hypothetical protein